MARRQLKRVVQNGETSVNYVVTHGLCVHQSTDCQYVFRNTQPVCAPKSWGYAIPSYKFHLRDGVNRSE